MYNKKEQAKEETEMERTAITREQMVKMINDLEDWAQEAIEKAKTNEEKVNVVIAKTNQMNVIIAMCNDNQ